MSRFDPEDRVHRQRKARIACRRRDDSTGSPIRLYGPYYQSKDGDVFREAARDSICYLATDRVSFVLSGSTQSKSSSLDLAR